MVRNPFERLLSGYRDKGWSGFFPEKVFPVSFPVLIINFRFKEIRESEYRKGVNSTIVDFDTKDLMGFNDFLDDLIIKGPEIGLGGHFGVRTRHWTRYYDICHFCSINYDIIAKVENVDQEASFVLQKAGRDNLKMDNPLYCILRSI